MPLSPKQGPNLPGSVSTKTINIASMKSHFDNATPTPVGKNVQRIRLKKRSEANITPLQIANSRLRIETETVSSKPTTPNPDGFATAASTANFNTNIRKSQPGDAPNDWRISMIEPSSAAAKTPFTPSDDPSTGKSPEIKMKKFVGMNTDNNMMISAI